MKFNEVLQNVMAERNLTNYKLAKMVGCSQSTVKYWCEGRTVPQNRTMDALAKALGVTAAYLRGEEDENGLTPSDWRSMGFAFNGYRLSCGRSIEYVADGSGVSADTIRRFENDGFPIAKKDLIVMCGLLNGATLNDVFYSFADAFDKAERIETTSDGGDVGTLMADDFTVAMHSLSKDLTSTNKLALIQMAEQLAEAERKRRQSGEAD